MAVSVFKPQVSVVLKKNIGRATVAGTIAASARFKGTDREIDMTPYLGDSGAVVVSKSVRQPSGMFYVTLADKMAPGEFESLYGLIEPMDVVEIRMARETQGYAGALDRNMPVMMRGFVTDVRRGEVMAGGRPQRSVTISGQDYGKILQILQIKYLYNEVLGQRLLTYFKFAENYGIGATDNKPAATFVREVVDNIVTPFLDDMRKAATATDTAKGVTPVLNIGTDVLVQDGIVSPFGTQQFQGELYGLLTYFGDVGPWNELYVEDREDAPYLVYRPNPFKDPEGKFIREPYLSDHSKAPAVVDVTDAEIVGLHTARSDSDVANYYWVDAARYVLVDGSNLRLMANTGDPDSFFLSDYPNSSPLLYGIRRMEVATQQGPRIDGQGERKLQQDSKIATDWLNDRRKILVAQNRDNVVFERGRLALRGNEQVRAGRLVRVTRGGFSWEAYAHQVTHEFLPFRSYTTTVEFDRGTGFIERVQRGNGPDAPYLSELNARGIYR